MRDGGNLSRAAQLLNLTQSALSHQVRALEDHYGTALFVRKSQPPAFAAAGQRLLRLADAVLPLVEDAERDVGRQVAEAAGSLRIAVECHTCFDWLMPACASIRCSATRSSPCCPRVMRCWTSPGCLRCISPRKR